MTQLIYQGLLNNVSKIITGHTTRFSIFDMLGQRSRELTHSAFIAQMLNPRGKHEMGTTFLNFFLEQLSLHETFAADNVEVELEKDFGPKEGAGVNARGGRIDIYIKNGKGQIIVVENKIYATDQIDQLQRYRNSAGPQTLILYLTLDGHAPLNSPISIGYKLISYSKDIKCWLNKCLEAVRNNRHLYTIIQQYMYTIDNLTSDQEVTKIIQSTSSNIRAALHIADVVDEARKNLKRKFLEDLARHLSLKSENIHKNGKEIILRDSRCDWCVEDNVFIRFKELDENKLVSQYINRWWQQNEHGSSTERNWIYLKLHGDKINLHDFNANASLWLDNNDAFWSDLEVEIQKIKDLLKKKI